MIGAAALVESMVGHAPPAGGARRTIRLEGEDLEGLFVAWLNEIIYLVASGLFLPASCRLLDLRGNRLTAEAAGAPPSEGGFVLYREVKAATYHGVELVEEEAGWRGRVLFDV